MAKAQIGKTYAQIVNNRCHKVFTISDLPEWNENDIQVVEVPGPVPAEGDTWNGSSFEPYVPPPPTQAQINAAADAAIFKLFKDNIPDLMDALEAAAVGPAKAKIKAINDAVKLEKAKKQ